MKKKRIFIGSFIQSPELTKLFEKLKEELKDKANIKWTRTPENFHITYIFLGEMPVYKVEEIQEFINKEFKNEIEAGLQIKGLNFFKRKGKPSVLYADITPNEQLKKIYQKINAYLNEKGMISSKKSHFKPHITLGRIKKVNPDFFESVNQYNKENLGDISSVKVEIIESKLSPQGALYKKI